MKITLVQFTKRKEKKSFGIFYRIIFLSVLLSIENTDRRTDIQTDGQQKAGNSHLLPSIRNALQTFIMYI